MASAFPADCLHVVDLPYRLSSWALDFPENIALWEDGEGRLLAWAVMQTPWWEIDCVIHPHADKNLYMQIITWADGNARQMAGTAWGRPSWYVSVFTGQQGRIRTLEEAGFASQADVGENSWSKVLMQRDAQAPLANYRIPAGFTVRPLAGESEVEAYVALHRSVFESKSMTTEWRMRTLRHPGYRPDLDLVVAAPDGRLAAFCIGWFQENVHPVPSGRIEPLGCHQDFRRYALGRLALAEALRRLQSCGAQQITVETDNYRNTAFDLYQSLGFRVIRDVLVYRKDYASNKN